MLVFCGYKGDVKSSVMFNISLRSGFVLVLVLPTEALFLLVVNSNSTSLDGKDCQSHPRTHLLHVYTFSILFFSRFVYHLC